MEQRPERLAAAPAFLWKIPKLRERTELKMQRKSITVAEEEREVNGFVQKPRKHGGSTAKKQENEYLLAYRCKVKQKIIHFLLYIRESICYNKVTKK